MSHLINQAARLALHLSVCAFALGSFISSTPAGIKEDVGLVTLGARMGSVPTGAGVRVAMTEAVVNGGYTPMTELPDFAGKHFEFRSGVAGNSAHATLVAENFFGLSDSIAPGINTIELYDANDYISTGFLNAGSWTQTPKSSPQNSRVGNHSWISNGSTIDGTVDMLEREDWLVDRDDFIQIVGVNNGDGNMNPIMSNAFNVIAVGRSDGFHAINTVALEGIYTAYRTRPEIVVPMGATSFSTPVVSAASALLVEKGHSNPSLSNGSYAPSRFPGTTIFNAETSEVVKATLMAGASRLAFNSNDSSAITDYRGPTNRQSSNGLDKRFGAGQLNVDNSFSILNSGEQDSRADERIIDVLPAGFDYDPQFGGAGGSNSTGTYEFTAGWTGQTLTASLAWNAKIDINLVKQGQYVNAATLYDLNLSLYDITTGSPTVVSASTSSSQNSENIWASLVGGRRYRLEVSPGSTQVPFNWDYGLAWSTVGTIGWRGGLWDNNISPSWTRGKSAAGFMPGEHVVFSDAGITGLVTIVGSVAPASVLVDNAAVPYVFQGSSIAGATGLVKRGSGQLTLMNANTYTGATIVDGGLLRVVGSINNSKSVNVGPQGTFAVDGSALVGSLQGAGTTIVGNGILPATLMTSRVQQGSLLISAGSQVTTWNSGGTSVIGALSIAGSPTAPSAKFDLNNNAAVIDHNGASPVATLREQILAGRGKTGFGAIWNGMGITSSAAAAANAGAPEARSIGYAENSQLPLGPFTTFRGATVDSTSVLIAFTRTGDANLDGIVNDDDVTIVGTFFSPSIANPTWAKGDFDYNGVINDDDVTLLGVFYNPTATPVITAAGDPDPLGGLAAVPEPAGIILLLLGGAVMLAGGYIRARRLR